MRAAVDGHSKITRDALMGKGMDRHLFALNYLAAAEGKAPALFSCAALERLRHIILSTSTLNSEALASGGFGSSKLERELFPHEDVCVLSPAALGDLGVELWRPWLSAGAGPARAARMDHDGRRPPAAVVRGASALPRPWRDDALLRKRHALSTLERAQHQPLRGRQ